VSADNCNWNCTRHDRDRAHAGAEDDRSGFDPLRIELPPDALSALVERVTEVVLEQLHDERRDGSPWLSGADAAARYLGWPRARVYRHLHELPHVKHGSRLMFRRSELDAFIEAGGA
jgi:excisionase family DNA binding protein